MEIKNLFGYAAALSLLSIGLLSCEKPAEDDDNGGNPPTVTVRYSVKVTEVTETSAKAEVACVGSETATWYAFVTEDLTADTDEVIASEVAGLEDIASVLKSGNAEVEFTGLTAGTGYRVIVTGLDADGNVSGNDEEEFKTDRDPDVWVENPDWSVEYVDRGMYNLDDGSTMYGDGITVTVAEGNTEYYYLTFVTRNEFETEYNGSVAAFANATVELLNQDIEDWNAQYPDSPASVLDALYTVGGGIILSPLADEEWYLFMIGINPSGVTGEGSGLYAQSEAFTPNVAEASAEYLSWTGSWLLEGNNIDGTPAQDTITVVESIPEYEYKVSGWQDGVDAYYAGASFTAQYDPATKNMTFIAEDELATFYDDPVEPGYLSFSGIVTTETLLGYVPEDYPDEMAITGGPYVIATFSNSNGTVTVTPNTIPLASGNSVTLESMGYFYYITGGQYAGYYNYYTMPKPYFPMTMTRIEDSASASAKAVPAGQVTASARKGKVAKAGYRTLSPLKTVYKVR